MATDEEDFIRKLSMMPSTKDHVLYNAANKRSKPNPSPEVSALLQAANASLPAHSVSPLAPRPRYLDYGYGLGSSGWTYASGGPLDKQSFVTTNDLHKVPMIQAHEAYHERSDNGGDMPKVYVKKWGKAPTLVDPNSIDNPHRGALAQLMERFQPNDQYILWGMNPNKNANEQIANLAGYEGAQPKGTSIVDTPVGKAMTPDQRDYYFTQSSVPYGGIWEGQIKDSMLDKLKKWLR